MKITFKNVEQGDTILLEWQDEGLDKVGLIDCNKIGQQNPALEYIKAKTLFEFDFIILSHPHSDHFSGMLEMLLHLKDNKIVVNTLYHTLRSTKLYITQSLRSVADQRTLLNIMKSITEMYKSGQIKKVGAVDGHFTSTHKLNPNYSFKFIYPTEGQYQAFNREEFRNWNGNNNSNANILCTMIHLFNQDRALLLTSDCIKNTFNSVNRQDHIELKDMIGIQMPHHGSKDNFNLEFWKKIKSENSGRKVYVSVGPNGYGHPDSVSLRQLEKLGFEIEFTNNVNSSIPSPSSHPLYRVARRVPIRSIGQDIVVDLV